MQDIAIKRKLSDMVNQYNYKKDNIVKELEEFREAGSKLMLACTIDGEYGRENIDTGKVNVRTLLDNLNCSAWLKLYKTLNLDVLMTAKDKALFEKSLSERPDFTMENIRATFGDYIINPRENILRGLAEVFCELDQSFKSHEKMKIGVDGLPKRIIIGGFNGRVSWGWERLCNVVNAIASFRGEPLMNYWELENKYKEDGKDFLGDRGMELRLFRNGNGHLFFNKDTLKDINMALSEYYGDVLPDCYGDRPEKRATSTEISKDLQYYPTPVEVVDILLRDIYIKDNDIILEPSCGCGRIMDGVRNKQPRATVHGIEYDYDRANIAKSKGHKVYIANFLEVPPDKKYDKVIMNPPFYGKHYAKHIEHAMKFLKDDGVLFSILPITAQIDHEIIKNMGFRHSWRKLPIGSFRESGTNINTVILTMYRY